MGVWGFIAGAVFLLLILAVIGFLLVCGYIYYLHLKYDHIPGPPRDNLLLGHLPSLMKMMRNSEIIYDSFFEWIERYGPVIRLNGFHKVMIFVVSPEGVKEFLLSPKYTKDDFYDVLHNLFGARFMGRSLLADQNYDHWHKQRRIMDPAFKKANLLESLGIFNEKAEELMDRLTEKADWKSQVGMHNMMNRVTLDVIAKVTLSIS
ncbi:cholesterol 24-hydroxylase-like [Bufo gargarizans]|uniref:cholesterol 24-hydroxylase-like n=1 Tax=Bufo gargarizans TaxID=30331 RepID=UPI001CF2B4B1|nr:cholesterol 24-hydroxylase-like [Bufo gargarizans]